MQNDRKLAAILSADVAGYSRLMGDDENATLATLTEYREVMREQIAAHHGRVVNTPGDAMLAKFPSAVQTVESAIEIQRALAVRNAELPEHRRMRMRIDINLGDVIEQESALYGDGVNIAARLEALCEPGDVCVSGTIFDQVENKTSAGFKYAGEQTVKNIVKPVRAYHVRFSGAGSPARKQSARKAAFIVAGVVCAVLVGLAIWMTNSRQDWPDAAHDALLEMPTGPVIAVLPFTNMSGDSNQDYFSDGLTEDIITELARFREIYVLARNTTFQYKGQSVDVPAVARELGAQYVLEGSVRKSNHRVRITAQLIDASTGSHIWADRFDRDFSDVFEIQDEVTQKIVGLVAGGHGGLIQDTEKRKVERRRLTRWKLTSLFSNPRRVFIHKTGMTRVRPLWKKLLPLTRNTLARGMNMPGYE
ncbi:MAG: adenylate/guanylate cyclase domain-containing protein [Betaproteobacteria bacterium]|jgi:adenylate cyclase|nr:MAG: adenylate/guanylate cyclase domain-containing protein [Betaproteobacteria bacterium]